MSLWAIPASFVLSMAALSAAIDRQDQNGRLVDIQRRIEESRRRYLEEQGTATVQVGPRAAEDPEAMKLLQEKRAAAAAAKAEITDATKAQTRVDIRAAKDHTTIRTVFTWEESVAAVEKITEAATTLQSLVIDKKTLTDALIDKKRDLTPTEDTTATPSEWTAPTASATDITAAHDALVAAVREIYGDETPPAPPALKTDATDPASHYYGQLRPLLFYAEFVIANPVQLVTVEGFDDPWDIKTFETPIYPPPQTADVFQTLDVFVRICATENPWLTEYLKHYITNGALSGINRMDVGIVPFTARNDKVFAKFTKSIADRRTHFIRALQECLSSGTTPDARRHAYEQMLVCLYDPAPIYRLSVERYNRRPTLADVIDRARALFITAAHAAAMDELDAYAFDADLNNTTWQITDSLAYINADRSIHDGKKNNTKTAILSSGPESVSALPGEAIRLRYSEKAPADLTTVTEGSVAATHRVLRPQSVPYVCSVQFVYEAQDLSFDMEILRALVVDTITPGSDDQTVPVADMVGGGGKGGPGTLTLQRRRFHAPTVIVYTHSHHADSRGQPPKSVQNGLYTLAGLVLRNQRTGTFRYIAPTGKRYTPADLYALVYVRATNKPYWLACHMPAADDVIISTKNSVCRMLPPYRFESISDVHIFYMTSSGYYIHDKKTYRDMEEWILDALPGTKDTYYILFRVYDQIKNKLKTLGVNVTKNDDTVAKYITCVYINHNKTSTQDAFVFVAVGDPPQGNVGLLDAPILDKPTAAYVAWMRSVCDMWSAGTAAPITKSVAAAKYIATPDEALFLCTLLALFTGDGMEATPFVQFFTNPLNPPPAYDTPNDLIKALHEQIRGFIKFATAQTQAHPFVVKTLSDTFRKAYNHMKQSTPNGLAPLDMIMTVLDAFYGICNRLGLGQYNGVDYDERTPLTSNFKDDVIVRPALIRGDIPKSYTEVARVVIHETQYHVVKDLTLYNPLLDKTMMRKKGIRRYTGDVNIDGLPTSVVVYKRIRLGPDYPRDLRLGHRIDCDKLNIPVNESTGRPLPEHIHMSTSDSIYFNTTTPISEKYYTTYIPGYEDIKNWTFVFYVDENTFSVKYKHSDANKPFLQIFSDKDIYKAIPGISITDATTATVYVHIESMIPGLTKDETVNQVPNGLLQPLALNYDISKNINEFTVASKGPPPLFIIPAGLENSAHKLIALLWAHSPMRRMFLDATLPVPQEQNAANLWNIMKAVAERIQLFHNPASPAAKRRFRKEKQVTVPPPVDFTPFINLLKNVDVMDLLKNLLDLIDNDATSTHPIRYNGLAMIENTSGATNWIHPLVLVTDTVDKNTYDIPFAGYVLASAIPENLSGIYVNINSTTGVYNASQNIMNRSLPKRVTFRVYMRIASQATGYWIRLKRHTLPVKIGGSPQRSGLTFETNFGEEQHFIPLDIIEEETKSDLDSLLDSGSIRTELSREGSLHHPSPSGSVSSAISISSSAPPGPVQVPGPVAAGVIASSITPPSGQAPPPGPVQTHVPGPVAAGVIASSITPPPGPVQAQVPGPVAAGVIASSITPPPGPVQTQVPGPVAAGVIASSTAPPPGQAPPPGLAPLSFTYATQYYRSDQKTIKYSVIFFWKETITNVDVFAAPRPIDDLEKMTPYTHATAFAWLDADTCTFYTKISEPEHTEEKEVDVLLELGSYGSAHSTTLPTLTDLPIRIIDIAPLLKIRPQEGFFHNEGGQLNITFLTILFKRESAFSKFFDKSRADSVAKRYQYCSVRGWRLNQMFFKELCDIRYMVSKGGCYSLSRLRLCMKELKDVLPSLPEMHVSMSIMSYLKTVFGLVNDIPELTVDIVKGAEHMVPIPGFVFKPIQGIDSTTWNVHNYQEQDKVVVYETYLYSDNSNSPIQTPPTGAARTQGGSIINSLRKKQESVPLVPQYVAVPVIPVTFSRYNGIDYVKITSNENVKLENYLLYRYKYVKEGMRELVKQLIYPIQNNLLWIELPQDSLYDIPIVIQHVSGDTYSLKFAITENGDIKNPKNSMRLPRNDKYKHLLYTCENLINRDKHCTLGYAVSVPVKSFIAVQNPTDWKLPHIQDMIIQKDETLQAVSAFMTSETVTTGTIPDKVPFDFVSPNDQTNDSRQISMYFNLESPPTIDSIKAYYEQFIDINVITEVEYRCFWVDNTLAQPTTHTSTTVPIGNSLGVINSLFTTLAPFTTAYNIPYVTVKGTKATFYLFTDQLMGTLDPDYNPVYDIKYSSYNPQTLLPDAYANPAAGASSGGAAARPPVLVRPKDIALLRTAPRGLRYKRRLMQLFVRVQVASATAPVPADRWIAARQRLFRRLRTEGRLEMDPVFVEAEAALAPAAALVRRIQAFRE